MGQVRDRLRLKHYSMGTETAYSGWIKRYIFFHGKRLPGEMGRNEVEAFLTSLVVERNFSAATQNQAVEKSGCYSLHSSGFLDPPCG